MQQVHLPGRRCRTATLTRGLVGAWPWAAARGRAVMASAEAREVMGVADADLWARAAR